MTMVEFKALFKEGRRGATSLSDLRQILGEMGVDLTSIANGEYPEAEYSVRNYTALAEVMKESDRKNILVFSDFREIMKYLGYDQATINSMVDEESYGGMVVSDLRQALIQLTSDYLDVVIPVITLIGSASVAVDNGDEYIDEGAKASDDRGGVITEDIVVGGDEVDTDTDGVYIITYDVEDEAGNAAVQVTRTVTVTTP